MHGPTTSIFDFSGFSSVFPYGPIELQALPLHLRFLGYPRRARLVHHWCSLVSIPSDSSALDFSLEDPLHLLWEFSGTLARCILGIIWHSFVAHFGRYIARLLDSLLLRDILFSGIA